MLPPHPCEGGLRGGGQRATSHSAFKEWGWSASYQPLCMCARRAFGEGLRPAATAHVRGGSPTPPQRQTEGLHFCDQPAIDPGEESPETFGRAEGRGRRPTPNGMVAPKCGVGRPAPNGRSRRGRGQETHAQRKSKIMRKITFRRKIKSKIKIKTTVVTPGKKSYAFSYSCS
jgi:hypothetical protein